MFQGCGIVLDQILPRKRDRNNVRYWFVKNTTEEEAEKLILNAKSKGAWGAKIKMQINERGRKDREHVKKVGLNDEKLKTKVDHKPGILREEEDPLIKTMFEYIEADVGEAIEKGLFRTKVVYSKKELEVDPLQAKFIQENMSHIKVVGFNERMFLLRTEAEEGWAESELEKLKG